MRRLWWSVLRYFFRLLYNELAWSYDIVAWMASLGEWKNWGRASIPYLEDKQVLELAHGPGHLLVAMKKRGLSPVGLDLSPYMGRLAMRRLKRERERVPLVRARAQALPFHNASFPNIVATFPTDFIVDLETLREIVRVLEPEGRLVVAIWARLDGTNLPSRFINWLYQVTGQGAPSLDWWKARMNKAGLLPRVVWESVGNSSVMLIVAEQEHPQGVI